VIVLAKKDVEVQLHALQTMTEQFQLCERGHCHLGKLPHSSEKLLDRWMHLITQPAYVLPCSNSAMNGNNGNNRILYHDIAVQTITKPPPCLTVGTRLQASLGVLKM
jgi:hypothetical protein